MQEGRGLGTLGIGPGPPQAWSSGATIFTDGKYVR